MCIICNLGDYKEIGEAFLADFGYARSYMQRAEEAMLEASRKAPDEADRKRYDATHKQMVRVRREWNKIEQMREQEV